MCEDLGGEGNVASPMMYHWTNLLERGGHVSMCTNAVIVETCGKDSMWNPDVDNGTSLGCSQDGFWNGNGERLLNILLHTSYSVGVEIAKDLFQFFGEWNYMDHVEAIKENKDGDGEGTQNKKTGR